MCRLPVCAAAAIAFCTTISGQQAPSILGVVHKVGGPPVSHVEVRIEGSGATLTSDSGEFALPMTANLQAGMLARIPRQRMGHLNAPCDLQNGRAYSPRCNRRAH